MGSLGEHARHKPGGGDKKIMIIIMIMIITGGGDKKIESRKLEWNVTSKVYSCF